MANYYSTTRELVESIFKRAQRIYVEVVCWLVEKLDVSATLQHLGKVNAVTFST